MSVYEIPLKPQPQTVSVKFPNGVTYQLRLIYEFGSDDCWLLDISDSSGNPILCGVPLVTGADLFAQYAYLGFGCSLYCTTDGDRFAVPKWWNLGVTAHLWISN
jgi:hypothetical protein